MFHYTVTKEKIRKIEWIQLNQQDGDNATQEKN